LNRIRLAHVSDLHLPLAPAAPRLRDLFSKRLLSWLSWRWKRRSVHRPEVLAQVMADVGGAGIDHLAVTGDLTNLSLPDEFARARDWLAAQGPGAAVTAIPGNHDALVDTPQAEGPGLWSPWMGEGTDFPFVKRVGPVALVGVSSAVPTAPFLASGRIGTAQLKRLESLLQALESEGLFRVVLVHHPITDGAVSERKALTDRAALRAVLARAGAELVLHGHSHEAAIASVPGPRGPIAVVSAPSASAAPAAGWGLVEVEAANAAWQAVVSLRMRDADGRFSAGESIDLQIARLPRPER
jgi:3',5'-cyclic AMP phosphodiesterase CpdA